MRSEHLFFITERITDILEVEEERDVEWSDYERIRNQRTTLSLRELHKVLSWVVDYLREVEKRSDKQLSDHKKWYLELRDIADSADDILNRVISNDVVNDDTNDTATLINQLVNRIRSTYTDLPSQPTYNFNANENNTYAGSTLNIHYTVNIDPSHSSAPSTNKISRPNTSALYPDPDLFGFNDEIQTLLDHLTQDNETRVVGIVGMGGSGKTTLAKHVYHHSKINTHFSRKIWICLSESWDKTTILNEICSQVIPEAGKMVDGQAIHSLCERLTSQSYLLVIDDMWSVDAWYHISAAFPPSSGSKVVITSRNKAIPIKFDGIYQIVEPKPLDDKESWELFKKKAFLPDDISGMLLQLGEEMVKECKGLPLAIIALAGVLKMNTTKWYWISISTTLRDNILKEKNQSTQVVVKEVLELSYYKLDHHLKQCVLYLRLFPEDYEIKAENLMEMWIAEGFISTNEDQESIAEQYLYEIVQRYIVQVVKTNFMGQVKIIKLHDLIRQTLVDIDKESGFLTDSLRLCVNITKPGHVWTYNFSNMSKSVSVKSIANVERVFLSKTSSHIRSVIFFDASHLYRSVSLLMFMKFRLLRVLILHYTDTPEELGNLIHLRYFELKGFRIRFPGFIGNLRNLQTLNIREFGWSSDDHQAGMNLCKLKELRHLLLPGDTFLNAHTSNLKLERLEKLKTLWSVEAGEWMLLGMTGNVVLERLRVLRISSDKQLGIVFTTLSKTSNNLQTLELDWYGTGLWYYARLRDMNILRECKRLTKLKLRGQIEAGTDLIFPPNLIKLEMRHSYMKDGEVMNIISESCPHLEILSFFDKAFEGERIVCNANSFPKLVELTVSFPTNVKQWIIESTAMPSLHCLTIYECRKLTVTPEGRTRILQIPQLIIKYWPHYDSFLSRDKGMGKGGYLSRRS